MKQTKKLTPCQTRLAVAKEVLELIELDLTVAKSSYLRPVRGQSVRRFDGDAAELQASIITLVPECQVCAKGAMVLAHIKLFDGVDYLPMYNAADSYCDAVLGDTFSSVVEEAFEGWGDKGGTWLLAVPDPKERLRYIMQNIVKNEGVFKINEVPKA